MNVVRNENPAPFDVDGTLILPATNDPRHRHIDVIDPVNAGKSVRFRVHEPMVRILQEEHQRGSYITVWSRSGWEWANNVVLALALEKYVHVVMSKPKVYFDDVPIENWLKDRVLLDPDIPYKV